MNIRSKRLGILLAATALAACPPARAGETAPAAAGTGVLATVNGAALTRTAALRMLPAPGPGPLPATSTDREALDRVTDFLVLRTLVEQAAQTPAGPEDLFAAASGATAAAASPAPPRPRLTRELLELFQSEARGDPRLGAAVEELLERLPQRPAPPTETELREAFERNRATLRLPDRAHVRHILVGVSSNDTTAARAAKRQRAEELRRQLGTGGDFAALARAHSDCPSRAAGGELGVLTRGQLQPELERAVFAVTSRTLLPVVESPQGFHVVEVLERAAPGPVSFEEARPGLTRWLLAQRRQAALESLLRQLARRATILYAAEEEGGARR